MMLYRIRALANLFIDPARGAQQSLPIAGRDRGEQCPEYNEDGFVLVEGRGGVEDTWRSMEVLNFGCGG